MSAAENGGTPDLSAMLGAVLSNPNAMAMLSSLLAGRMGSDTGVTQAATAAATAVGQPSGAGGVSGAGGIGGVSSVSGAGVSNEAAVLPTLAPVRASFPAQDERAALVAALRPFLPPEKCEMIDGLLRIMDLLFLFRGRRQ